MHDHRQNESRDHHHHHGQLLAADIAVASYASALIRPPPDKTCQPADDFATSSPILRHSFAHCASASTNQLDIIHHGRTYSRTACLGVRVWQLAKGKATA